MKRHASPNGELEIELQHCLAISIGVVMDTTIRTQIITDNVII